MEYEVPKVILNLKNEKRVSPLSLFNNHNTGNRKMICNTKIQTYIDTPPEVRKMVKHPFEFRNLCFEPHYDGGAIRYYKSEWRGLWVKLCGDHLSIRNSLQKFYHGDNYGDFYRSEIDLAVNEIADNFQVTPQSWKVIKIEIGVNISTEHSEQNYLDLFHLYKGINFYPIRPGRGSSKVIGIECPLTEYVIKCYNKRLQVRLADKIELPFPLVRFEIAIEKKINTNHLPFLHHFGELYDHDKLFQIGEFLKSKFNQIIMKPEMNFSQLKKLKDKELIAAMQNSAFRTSLRSDHPHSLKNYSRKYKSLCNGLKSGLAEELKKKIDDTVEMQISG